MERGVPANRAVWESRLLIESHTRLLSLLERSHQLWLPRAHQGTLSASSGCGLQKRRLFTGLEPLRSVA